MVQGPLFVEIKEPVIEKICPCKTIPVAPLVVRFPFIVVVPVAVVCVIDEALMELVEMFFALAKVRTPSGVVAPADPTHVMLATPGFSVNPPGPLSVEEKVMG